MVYPSESFAEKVMSVRGGVKDTLSLIITFILEHQHARTQVRDKALKSFEMETRREAEAKEDFMKHQSCEKLNARHCENSFESMILPKGVAHDVKDTNRSGIYIGEWKCC